MTDLAERALLPAGLRDILPPFAAHEASVVTRLMSAFALHGYERVKPPLVEFESSLLGDGATAKSTVGRQTFSIMDPLTQRMMAVRSDMTPQVARIAATRLGKDPRPLRLAYAGQVLRIKGSQLRAERQFGQVGVELIGAAELTAEAEILAMCVEALTVIGLTDITVDLTLSALVPLVVGPGDDTAALRDALDHKDVTSVAAAGGRAAALLTGLIEAVGPADRALARIAALDLPAAAVELCGRLADLVALIRTSLPGITLTIDPVENRGFEYYTGIGFTIFSGGCAGEIGRGGRYDLRGESSVGATLFMDTVLEIVPTTPAARRVYLPVGTDRAAAAILRGQGWVTINGLAPVADIKAEARRLRCGHHYVDEKCEESGNG